MVRCNACAAAPDGACANRCPAHSRRTKLRCGAHLPAGAVVCRDHGGRTPQAKAKQQERLMESEVRKQLGIPLEVDAGEATVAMVHEAAGNVAFLRILVQALAEDELTGLVSRGQWGGEKHEPHVLVRMYDAERDRLAAVAAGAVKLGIDERRVRIAEHTTDRLYTAVTTALQAAGLTPTQQEAFRVAIAAELRQLGP